MKVVKVMKGGSPLFFMTFIVFLLFTCSSCNSPAAGPLLVTLSDAVVVTGLSGGELRSLRSANWNDDNWQALLRVTVTGNNTSAVAGKYVVTPQALRFEPRFPFDPGRSYSVRFDPSRLPAPRADRVLEQTLALPGRAVSPTTVVTAIYPTTSAWPENILRFYIHFSAPMSATTGVKFVHLIDDTGEEVAEAFLVLDADLWNSDYTRCTVFFDPGRVKRGVGPNLELGRAIREGKRYTVIVDAAWPDANGQPLKAAYRHEVRGGPPIEKPLSLSDWRIAAPATGTRDALTVTFPWSLDRALLTRATGVTHADGRGVEGDIAVESNETIMKFTPRAPWQAGEYRLAVLTILEDPSGNRVGRAFEIKAFERGDRGPQLPERSTLPFTVK